MERYRVTGMSCAACQSHVERAVRAVPGVTSCAVSLLTNSMQVEGTAAVGDIVKAVKDAGYGAAPAGSADKVSAAPEEDGLEDRETPQLLRCLLLSLAVLLPLMYLSLGHMRWGFPIPFFLENAVCMGIAQLILSSIVLFMNRKFFTGGFGAFLHRSTNMDTLVALGSAASFLYSLTALFAMAWEMGKGNAAAVNSLLMNHLWFETAAMIPCLITFGKTLESYSKGRTTDALKSLMKLAPKTAMVEKDGKETEIPIAELKPGDIFIVKPGQNIPADGVIVSGTAAIDESALTGESVPCDRKEGDEVAAATVNKSGFIRCRTLRAGEDTSFAAIVRLVSDAAATKAPISRIADRVSAVFVPGVIIVSLITLMGWLIAGSDFAFALARAVSVLVISCPCALGLATPVAIMVGNGVGARNGILFKTAAALESAGRTSVIALDKTGTVTRGKPEAAGVIPADGQSEKELLSLAYSLEKMSDHPLAAAVSAYAEAKGTVAEEVTGFREIPGKGLEAELGGEKISGGSRSFISSIAEIPEEIGRKADEFTARGATPLFFARGKELIGVIAVADAIRDESREAIQSLRNMGIRTVMLTGDNERTAAAIGREAGVDLVVAGVLPDEKSDVVGRLRASGMTAMVGDGINDAPALTAADTGIAVGAGTDVAIDAADAVLMRSRLDDVPAAVRLSRAAVRNIHQNLFWAFFYNVACIPLAAGVYQALFHWNFELSPAVGALAMSLSSVTVCMNALRLNFTRIHDGSHDRPSGKSLALKGEATVIRKGSPEEAEYLPGDAAGSKNGGKGEEMAEERLVPGEGEQLVTVGIQGMMCGHCERAVKSALLALGVRDARVSYKEGTAELVFSDETITDQEIKDAVQEQGYLAVYVERDGKAGNQGA